MKKLLPLLFIGLLLLLFAACNYRMNDPDNGGNNTTHSQSIIDKTASSDYIGNNNITSTAPSGSAYTLKTYSWTDEYGNAGTFTEINSKYNVGNAVELEATVNPGYNFVGWFIEDTCVSEDLKYTYTMKSSNVEIEAKYSYYTVSTYSNSNDYEKAGTYTILKGKKISVGEQVTLEATVNAGYNFDGWFINDVCVGESLTYSFPMKDKNLSLEARWSYHTVTVESYTDEQGTAGSFTKKNNEKISVGDSVTLTATVNNGYNFEGWYIGSVCVCSDLTYQFVMDKTNKYIEAKYSYYTLTTRGYCGAYDMTTDIVGTFTKYKESRISVGETVTLIATVNDGFTFQGWYVGGNCVSTDLEYSFKMSASNITVEAIYCYYRLTTTGFVKTSSSSGYSFDDEDIAGTYTKFDETKVSVGKEITLVATVKDGYKFVGWMYRNEIISEELTYSFTMGESDKYFEAVFKKE